MNGFIVPLDVSIYDAERSYVTDYFKKQEMNREESTKNVHQVLVWYCFFNGSRNNTALRMLKTSEI